MRANGQGSVFPASLITGPDGKPRKRPLPWCASITVGWTLAGHPVRRSRFAASKAEGEVQLADMLKARRAGRPVPDDRVTLKAWLPAWIDHRTDLRPATVRIWRLAADHLLRRLGSLRVRRLTPTDLETALADMPTGIAGVARVLLVTALRDAERDGLVDRNVARLSRAPKVIRSETTIPDAEQARALIAGSSGHRLGALIVMALGTGLRQGEMLGLTRECLDLDVGIARIDWQLSWATGEPVLSRPKTATSRRRRSLAPFVVAALRAHRARQDAERLRAGTKWRDADGLVFTMADGRPVNPNVARYALDAIAAKAGIGHVRFHSLRHAAAQIVKELASQEAAQAMAGHASITTTDRYVAPSDVLERAATAALEEALG